MDDNTNKKYYILCDESGNDTHNPVIGCVIVEKDVYNNLLKIIKPEYHIYEKKDTKFKEIHFAYFTETTNFIHFALDIISNISHYIRFYSLILNEKIDNNNKKDYYYNVLFNKMLEDFDIKQFQIDKIVIDR